MHLRAFPGSVYVYRGEKYMVTDFDVKNKKVGLHDLQVDEYLWDLLSPFARIDYHRTNCCRFLHQGRGCYPAEDSTGHKRSKSFPNDVQC